MMPSLFEVHEERGVAGEQGADASFRSRRARGSQHFRSACFFEPYRPTCDRYLNRRSENTFNQCSGGT